MARWKRRKKYRIAKQEQEFGFHLKKFQISHFLRRELIFMFIFVLISSITLLGGSYAILSHQEKAKQYNVIKSGTLQIAFDDTSDGLGNIIRLNGAYPESDAVGQEREPYRFKITNTGSLNVDYKVKILDDTSMIEEDGCADKLLEKSKLRYSIDKGKSALLSDVANEYVVAIGSLSSGESVVYEVRMWIDEMADNEVLGKHYHGKIVVEGVQESGNQLYKSIAKVSVPDDEASEFVSASTGINFAEPSSDTNGKGIYTLAATKKDTYPIYYYRGEVDNNNVKFAGFCWKIVRTTETGGIKLIYNGKPTATGACVTSVGTNTQIQTRKIYEDSPAYVGYMYGNVYSVNLKNLPSTNTVWIYGNDVEWDGSKYVLKGLYESNTSNLASDWRVIAQKYHYSCFSGENNCKEVCYLMHFTNLYEDRFYIRLTDGDNIETAKNKMFTNKNNSLIKAAIDSWYRSNLLDYTGKLEDTVWCNDRSIDRGSLKGKDEDASITDDTMRTDQTYFGAEKRIEKIHQPSLKCPNDNDKFTVDSKTEMVL